MYLCNRWSQATSYRRTNIFKNTIKWTQFDTFNQMVYNSYPARCSCAPCCLDDHASRSLKRRENILYRKRFSPPRLSSSHSSVCSRILLSNLVATRECRVIFIRRIVSILKVLNWSYSVLISKMDTQAQNEKYRGLNRTSANACYHCIC